MIRIKLLLTAVTLVALTLVCISLAPPVLAAPIDDACTGLQLADPNISCDQATAQSSFQDLIIDIVNILSVVIGAVAVIMLIIGGFRYVVSGGDATGTKGAKDTIMYAIIGLIVVLFSQVITRFVVALVRP